MLASSESENHPQKSRGIRAWFYRFIRHDCFPLLIIICINLVVGSLLVVDYGESWDEQLRYKYATKSLAAYMGEMRELSDEKGPFYVMLAKLGSDVLLRFHPDWLPIFSTSLSAVTLVRVVDFFENVILLRAQFLNFEIHCCFS